MVRHKTAGEYQRLNQFTQGLR